MNPFRAKRIADHFASVGMFEINNRLHGIEVNYRGQVVYFEEETAFWPFLFSLAQAAHQAGIIAEAEAKLIA
ncbi:MAG: hypothetical protein AUK35_06515 [Zetaproteobacteria bacterium CG2_30_46_52]|nr:MAG: hypothetical protein AUK35_06515 [Zetaproteobacteria bacterium CG2_30_46_52]